MSEKLIKEFEALDNDIERWKWVKDNQDNTFVVMCDNDDTFVLFDDDKNPGGGHCVDFSDYIGCSDGVLTLLKAMGIRAECV